MMHAAWRQSSIVVGFLLLLTYLLLQSSGPDLTLRARMVEALQSFALHDAELTRDVLLVRAGLLPNYDSLGSIARTWSEDVDTLRRESGSGSYEAAMTFREPIVALASAVDRKLTLIEYFKSDNALLRNSLIYANRAGQAPPSQADPETAAIADAGEISRAMLRFLLTPELGSASDIQHLLERMSILPGAGDEFEDFIAHGLLISQLLPQVDRQLRDIIAAPTAWHARALQDAVMRYSSRVETHAQLFRLLLYLAALVLLGYVIYQFVRLRLNATELHRANEELNQRIARERRLQEANRQQELQLIQANKMTALGILVSGVAHEINNPNQQVLTNSKVLTKVWDDAIKILDELRRERGEFTLARLAYAEMRETVAHLIRDVHAGALRIGQIVDDLKDFARPGERRTQSVFDLNDAVHRAIRLLAHLINQRTSKLRTNLSPSLPPMLGDAQQVEQIAINLVINALEALPERKRGITISTAYIASERSLALEVIDEGVGIARQHLERLCDPFFTTKHDSGGTGLGLAITSSLVRVHRGCMRFDSEPGKGTRVVVKFRCIEDADAAVWASDRVTATA
jgi:signal transduction histidine kinase